MKEQDYSQAPIYHIEGANVPFITGTMDLKSKVIGDRNLIFVDDNYIVSTNNKSMSFTPKSEQPYLHNGVYRIEKHTKKCIAIHKHDWKMLKYQTAFDPFNKPEIEGKSILINTSNSQKEYHEQEISSIIALAAINWNIQVNMSTLYKKLPLHDLSWQLYKPVSRNTHDKLKMLVMESTAGFILVFTGYPVTD